ncbi:serine/threonine-protein kinase [Vitiosangium sp. GDMCC 1.1324]|uniref:serine/threonine-protein kinase n=1 Tax=Vitiosangium sp. (strain GDMCC 1.1324) TaxID=2138576 RepID=UPI001E452069|nr:serine/threonine-protein kinase [Vitiosangium sp. GDMCC 1.1324]
MSTPGKEERTLEPTLEPEPTAAPMADRTLPGEREPQAANPPAPAPAEGARESFPVPHWDRYEFLEMLGRGGMGEVYKARDRRLGRVVALKFIRGADPDRVMRFLQEARAQARIDHPHVCKVFEVGDVSGKAYIAMQLIGGQPLDRAAPGMSLHEKVQVMKEVAEAIHEAHRLGVIHRDLKPSNIMVERGEDGRCFPVVMDFGLAYDIGQGHGLTETGALMGTPSYMAPEQARGDVRSIDRRSDVYSLGATLYELLTGVTPFSDTSLAGTLQKVLHEDPPSPRSHAPHLPSDLDTIALKCLNKEPDQRYPSARALAEDLGRYIDGEPILGQRPSLLYRLQRRARKHRALVAVSAVSLASIGVVGAFGALSWLEARHTRQQSEERARLAGELGQQVKEIEWFLRAAYTLPLHDTSREQQLVRERMARIATQHHELGDHGEGLVHYALGRGYLAMHEFELAHQELTHAREKGIDSPELHYARGRVLGELYHRAMEDARHSGDKAWVAERQRVLEKQYLEPALQSLERSQGLELESPRYLEGLIAFYRRQYDVAAQRAAQAVDEAPWMYEAQKLAGDVAYARAMEQLERGEYDKARAGLEAAVSLDEQAAESGRSDARIHESLAEAWLQQSVLDSRQGKSRKASLERALTAVGKGLHAAPQRASGYTKKAQVLMQWYRVMRFENGGLDPKPILAEWTATAMQAVKLDPRDVYAYDMLGYSHFTRGLLQAGEGSPPNAAYDEAISWLTRALELQPEYPWGHNDLAQVYLWKGNYQWEHGEDPRAAYAQAEHHLRQAARSDPAYLFAHVNLTDVYSQRAAYDLSRGRNPQEDVDKALQAGQQALAIDGNFVLALNQVALVEQTLASYLIDSGGDPRPRLEQAVQHLERSSAVNPTFGRTPLYRAMGHLLEVDHAMREGREPTAALEAGWRALAEASRHDPGWVECRLTSSRLALAEAAWAKRRGRPELPFLQKALAEARRALEMYPYYETHQQLARVHWRLAEAQPGKAPSSITEGLAQVDLALRLDPNLAHAHALRGALLLNRARTMREAAERLDILRQARAELARGLELNPLLRREYEAPIREAEALYSRPGPDGSGL